VTAVPSNFDGTDCCLSPQVFRTAVRYRLGLKVARSDVACSFCTQSFDEYGDHAACCRRNSDIIVRHNRLRNLVCRFAEEGLLSPVLEKRFLLGEASGRRPGDVTIPCWKNSKGLAVDAARSPPETSLSTAQQTPMGWSSTRSTTRASRALLSFSAPPFLRPQEGLVRKPCPFFGSCFGLRPASKTPSSVFMLVAPGPGWRATFRPRLLKPSFTVRPPAVTLNAVTLPPGRLWSPAAQS